MTRSQFIGCCLLLLSASATQAGDASTSTLIPGFYNPKTQTFTALTDRSGSSPAPAAAPAFKIIQGTIIVKAIITLDASVPANAQFQSRAYLYGGSTYNASPSATVRGGQVINTGTVTRSGATATTTIRLPYHMEVDSGSTTMSLTLYFSSNSATPPGLKMDQKFPLPANGATTTITIPGAM